MNSFINAMNNIEYTNNRAISNASSSNAIVDFFFHGAAMRDEPNEQRIINLFNNAFEENPDYALRILFYIRDVRGGQGERRVFRIILKNFANNNPDWVVDNLHLIPEYGRWDDMFELIYNSKISEEVIAFINKQLTEDVNNMLNKKPCSLLAKWMPSINTSSAKTRNMASVIINKLHLTHKTYRKTLARLRKYIDIVERHISSKDYESINYETVPSKANLKYKKAFIRNDNERYLEYLNNVNNGTAKINTNTLYPYEIVNKYRNNSMWYRYDTNDVVPDNTLETLWKNLPDYVDNLNGIVVADTSASMMGRPMDVSISLAIYIAERNKNEAFKNYFISFSQVPKFHKIEGDTLLEHIHSVILGDVANTNVQGVFDLILNRAIQYNVPNEEMPKSILIISDMEFDCACDNNSKTNFEVIKEKYIQSGYTMPTLVFWNVNSTHNHTPVTINDRGVVLVSGCSPVIMKYALSSCNSIMSIIEEVVNSSRYSEIKY